MSPAQLIRSHGGAGCAGLMPDPQGGDPHFVLSGTEEGCASPCAHCRQWEKPGGEVGG